MSIDRLTLFTVALLACSTVHAQDYQRNNRGVIVNQVIIVPTEPVRTAADNIRDYQNSRAASAAEEAAAAEEYLRIVGNRVAAASYRSELGTPMRNSGEYRVKQSLEINSSYSFSALDNIRWNLPAGTLFRFLTTPGPGGHAQIRLSNTTITIPATYNGFSHTPEVRSTAYILVNQAEFELVSPAASPSEFVSSPASSYRTSETESAVERNHFFQAYTTTMVVLRRDMSVNSLKMAILKAGAPIAVDKREGRLLPGWSAVKWYTFEDYGVRIVRGYVQTKYIRR